MKKAASADSDPEKTKPKDVDSKSKKEKKDKASKEKIPSEEAPDETEHRSTASLAGDKITAHFVSFSLQIQATVDKPDLGDTDSQIQAAVAQPKQPVEEKGKKKGGEKLKEKEKNKDDKEKSKTADKEPESALGESAANPVPQPVFYSYFFTHSFLEDETVKSEVWSGGPFSQVITLQKMIDEPFLLKIQGTGCISLTLWRCEGPPPARAPTPSSAQGQRGKAKATKDAGRGRKDDLAGEAAAAKEPEKLFSTKLFLASLLAGLKTASVHYDTKTAVPAFPPYVKEVGLSLTCDAPLLSEAMRKKYNPLEIRILKARNLPEGLSSYEKLRSQYQPVFAKYSFIDSAVNVSPPFLHDKHISLDFYKVLLPGLITSSEELHAYLLNQPLVIELHDRDIKEPEVQAIPITEPTPTPPAEPVGKGSSGASKSRQPSPQKELLGDEKSGKDDKDKKSGKKEKDAPTTPAKKERDASEKRDDSPAKKDKPGAKKDDPAAKKEDASGKKDKTGKKDKEPAGKANAGKADAGKSMERDASAGTVGSLGPTSAARPVSTTPTSPAPPPPVPQPPPNPYGVARFSLADLALGERSLKLCVNVLPARLPPKDPFQFEEGVREDGGGYIEAGTTLRVSVKLMTPFPRVAAPPNLQLNRAIYIFRYENTPVLQQLMSLINDINAKALGLDGGVQANARRLTTYRLSPAQKSDPKLDIITGFQVIDAEQRIFAVEGLAEKGMTQLQRYMSRTESNNENIRIITNRDVMFGQRAYLDLDVGVKRIKLRFPLDSLTAASDTYVRGKIAVPCEDALEKLAELRRVDWMADAKRMDMFPTVEMLKALEKKYGDVLVPDDIDGVFDNDISTLYTKSSVLSGEEHVQLRREHYKGSTEDKNPEFDFSIRHRPYKDHMHSNIASVAGPRRRPRDLRSTYPLPEDAAHVFIYSGQKLEYSTLQRQAMRQRFASEKGFTYTYGEFLSSAFPLEDKDSLAKKEKALSKAKMLTQKGFVYPPPRDPAEFNRHANRPSESRIKELSLPWQEPITNPFIRSQLPLGQQDASGSGSESASGSGSGSDGKRRRRRRKPFDTLPARPGALLEKDPAYSKSVFLTGPGMVFEAVERQQAEIEEWRSKVRVEDVNMRFYRSAEGRRRVHPLERTQGILKDPPSKKALRGRHKVQQLPTTIFADGAVESSYERTLRADDPTTFVSDKDFTLYMNKGKDVVGHVAYTTTPISPLKPSEKLGPLWGR